MDTFCVSVGRRYIPEQLKSTLMQNMQKIVLACGECNYTAEGVKEKDLMNKIIMWNHSKKAHPLTAERIMKTYQILPNHLYTIGPVAGAPR